MSLALMTVRSLPVIILTRVLVSACNRRLDACKIGGSAGERGLRGCGRRGR